MGARVLWEDVLGAPGLKNARRGSIRKDDSERYHITTRAYMQQLAESLRALRTGAFKLE